MHKHMDMRKTRVSTGVCMTGEYPFFSGVELREEICMDMEDKGMWIDVHISVMATY